MVREELKRLKGEKSNKVSISGGGGSGGGQRLVVRHSVTFYMTYRIKDSIWRTVKRKVVTNFVIALLYLIPSLFIEILMNNIIFSLRKHCQSPGGYSRCQSRVVGKNC